MRREGDIRDAQAREGTSRSQPPASQGEVNPAGTLVLDVWPPEPWGNGFFLVKLPSLLCFLGTSWANEDAHTVHIKGCRCYCRGQWESNGRFLNSGQHDQLCGLERLLWLQWENGGKVSRCGSLGENISRSPNLDSNSRSNCCIEMTGNSPIQGAFWKEWSQRPHFRHQPWLLKLIEISSLTLKPADQKASCRRTGGMGGDGAHLLCSS